MKKIISVIYIIVIIAVLSFVLPSQTYAAWWNPLSWFYQNKQTSDTYDTQPSDVKTIEDLKTEVATLKASLGTIYDALRDIQTAHNNLVKSVNAIVSSNKNINTATNNSNLDGRVIDLESKLYNVCRQVFSSLGGFGRDNCPSTGLIGKEALESRIKKLEGGY